MHDALGILAERLVEELALAEPDWDVAGTWLEELYRRWPRVAAG